MSSPRASRTTSPRSTASSSRSTCSSARRAPRRPATSRSGPRPPSGSRAAAAPTPRRTRSSSRSPAAPSSWRRRSTTSTASAGPSPATGTPWPRSPARSVRWTSTRSRSWRAMPRPGRVLGRRCPARSTDTLPPSLSRVVLNAQEDLRREIARSMHDGPAQSLTNITLQAQIVERLLDRDLDMARGRAATARPDGPADARGDEELHLRRPADGARRPGARADAPTRRARPRPAGARPRRVRFDGRRPTAAAGRREHRVPGARRGARRLPRAGARAGDAAARLDRGARSAPARPSGRSPCLRATTRSSRRSRPATLRTRSSR